MTSLFSSDILKKPLLSNLVSAFMQSQHAIVVEAACWNSLSLPDLVTLAAAAYLDFGLNDKNGLCNFSRIARGYNVLSYCTFVIVPLD